MNINENIKIRNKNCKRNQNGYIYKRTSDSLNEGLPIKIARQKFQRKR